MVSLEPGACSGWCSSCMGRPLVPAQTRILPPSGSFLGRWSQAILLGQVGDAVLGPGPLLLADVLKQADSEVWSGEEVAGPSQASSPQLWFPNQLSPEHLHVGIRCQQHLSRMRIQRHLALVPCPHLPSMWAFLGSCSQTLLTTWPHPVGPVLRVGLR